MNTLRSMVSVVSFALVSSTVALAGCTLEVPGDGEISIGDTATVESCIESCRAFANQCGFDDTCEKACALIDDLGCLEASQDLADCREDAADMCKATECMPEAKASYECTHDASCAKDPTTPGCEQ